MQVHAHGNKLGEPRYSVAMVLVLVLVLVVIVLAEGEGVTGPWTRDGKITVSRAQRPSRRAEAGRRGLWLCNPTIAVVE